jgi:hypothetical protein
MRKYIRNRDDLQISHLTYQTALKLYHDEIDLDYVHIYIHCVEKIEVLYEIRVIHGGIKADVFLNDASVV